MPTYLISFPSAAMRLAPEELEAASHDSRAVVQQAKDAGVWIFGGAVDDSVGPALVDAGASVTSGTHPQTGRIDGGFALLDLPSLDEAVRWASLFAAACRCAQEVRVFHDDPESRPEGASRA